MFTCSRGTAILLTCAPWLPLVIWTFGGHWHFSWELSASKSLIQTNFVHGRLFVVKNEYNPDCVISQVRGSCSPVRGSCARFAVLFEPAVLPRSL
jgi:hypothetical protein